MREFENLQSVQLLVNGNNYTCKALLECIEADLISSIKSDIVKNTGFKSEIIQVNQSILDNICTTKVKTAISGYFNEYTDGKTLRNDFNYAVSKEIANMLIAIYSKINISYYTSIYIQLNGLFNSPTINTPQWCLEKMNLGYKLYINRGADDDGNDEEVLEITGFNS